MRDNISNKSGTIHFPQGQKYIGDLKKGLPDGKGRLEFPDGGIYEGNFVDGRIEGEGEYKFPDGNVAKGIWKNNKPWDVIGTLETGEVYGYFEQGIFRPVEKFIKPI